MLSILAMLRSSLLMILVGVPLDSFPTCFSLVCSHASFPSFVACRPSFVSKTALSAEWEKDWKEIDVEGDLAKLQKEAEERLDDKIAELMANIETAGK